MPKTSWREQTYHPPIGKRLIKAETVHVDFWVPDKALAPDSTSTISVYRD